MVAGVTPSGRCAYQVFHFALRSNFLPTRNLSTFLGRFFCWGGKNHFGGLRLQYGRRSLNTRRQTPDAARAEPKFRLTPKGFALVTAVACPGLPSAAYRRQSIPLHLRGCSTPCGVHKISYPVNRPATCLNVPPRSNSHTGRIHQPHSRDRASGRTKKVLTDRILDPLLNRWWGKVLFGTAIVLLAYWLYGDFCRLEAGEKQLIVGSKLIVSTYKLFGKWPPVLLVAIQRRRADRIRHRPSSSG